MITPIQRDIIVVLVLVVMALVVSFYFPRRKAPAPKPLVNYISVEYSTKVPHAFEIYYVHGGERNILGQAGSIKEARYIAMVEVNKYNLPLVYCPIVANVDNELGEQR
jgi:hypothetical protein